MRLAPRFIFLQAIILAVAGTILLFSSFASVRIVGVVLLIGGLFGVVIGRAVAWDIGGIAADFLERTTTLTTTRRRYLAPKAYLIALEGLNGTQRTRFEIYGSTTIGRSRKYAELSFHTTEEKSPVSQLHCTILDESDHFAIRDEDTTNGTFLNGVRLPPLEPHVLQDGDVVELAPVERGGIKFQFSLASRDMNPSETPAQRK